MLSLTTSSAGSGFASRLDHSTVVWNPWQAVAEKMGDLGLEGYRHMLCVESANAADDVVSIAAGGQHTLSATYVLD